jgi:hypothetical protein
MPIPLPDAPSDHLELKGWEGKSEILQGSGSQKIATKWWGFKPRGFVEVKVPPQCIEEVLCSGAGHRHGRGESKRRRWNGSGDHPAPVSIDATHVVKESETGIMSTPNTEG